MILEPVRKKRSPEDDSFIGIRVGVLLIIAFVLFGVLAFRLWFLQILSGDEYVAVANDNRIREVKVEAPRGVIYDRNGKILVENRAGLSVGLLPMDMYDPKKEPEEFQPRYTSLAKVLDWITEPTCMARLRARPRRTLRDLRGQGGRAREHRWWPTSRSTAWSSRASRWRSPILRQYPFGALATHLLGYVGEISQNDLDERAVLHAEGRAPRRQGRGGATYDSYLRGTDGWKTVEVDAAGQPKRFVEDVAADSRATTWC